MTMKDDIGGNSFITHEHPDYIANRDNRRQYGDLYVGGQRFQANSADYLVRRHKEPNDIYFERLNRVFYENYVASIIDWYAATLFRREPVIQFDGPGENGKTFFDSFVGDCDRKGTTLTEFYRRQLTQALIQGKSYIVVDFPKSQDPLLSRAHEDLTGASRAYLADYSADEVVNWSYDEYGALDWIVLRTSDLRKSSAQEEVWRRETRWIYYDRENFAIYSSVDLGASKSAPVLTGSGRHALSAQRRVPVFEVKVSDGLWLMNKACLLQLEHFNKSNALAWALTMGLFATPVVYSDREFAQIVGESYFIQLGPQDRFGWTEPEGHVYQIASDNLDRLKTEIYRVCYLMNQVSGGGAQIHQSGLSKSWDFSVTQEILRVYGDVTKDSMRAVLSSIAEARRDDLQIDITGLDEFDIQDFGSEISDAKSLLAMDIPSETLKRQLYKRIALKYFCDARQDIKTQIASEIDQALGIR